MTNHQDLNERITELEAKVAYQDDTLETLNQVVINQNKQIDRLIRLVQKLESQVREQQTQGEVSNAIPEPPPPHY